MLYNMNRMPSVFIPHASSALVAMSINSSQGQSPHSSLDALPAPPQHMISALLMVEAHISSSRNALSPL